MSKLYIPPPDYGLPAVQYEEKKNYVAPDDIIPPPDYSRYEPNADYEAEKEEKIEVVAPKEEPKKKKEKEQKKDVDAANETKETSTSTDSGVSTEPEVKVDLNQPLTISTDPYYGQPPAPSYVSPADNYYYPPHHYSPQQNFVAHSYLEDRDKINPVKTEHRSMRSHIRSIGVPVLPIGGAMVNRDAGFMAVSPSQNKAFIRHMENHRRYDTMKSLKSCNECPICQMMKNEGWNEHQNLDELVKMLEESNNKHRRPDVRDLFNENEVESYEVTYTRRSYTERAEGEMSVDFRERVEIIQREPTHALCRKQDGTLGWLPNFILM